MTADATPMMLQYQRFKKRHADAVLFFRLGDFYEMFERDAREVSALLGLTLTSRNGVPMCGVPYHAARGYIARLLKAGKKIAICEQLALAKDGKGLADREIVEIITPGTVVDLDYLDAASNNYLVSLARSGARVSLSYIDLSTGEFLATEFPWDERAERLRKELSRLRPHEIIVQESLANDDPTVRDILETLPSLTVNRYPDWSFDLEASRQTLTRQFGTASLKGFGIGEEDAAILSAGVVIDYVAETSKSLLPHVRSLKRYDDSEFLGIDDSTQRNLEIVANLHDGSSRYTLAEVLDYTKTAMGSRRLKDWLMRPLRSVEAISSRLSKVESLHRNQTLLASTREGLAGILDLERLAARVAMDKAHGKDLVALRSSLASFERLAELLDPWSELRFWSQEQRGRILALRELLDRAIDDEASILLTEGHLIKKGYDGKLDELRSQKDNSRQILDGYLAEVRRASGIASLKLRYNRIIGHYFEVTKSNLDAVPSDFIRRQSLLGGERFTTERLADIESALNSATETAMEVERALFLEVRDRVKREVALLGEAAGEIGALDALQSFAQAATVRGYVRPAVEDSGRLFIAEGRHPVVEASLPPGDFVPNGCALDADGVSFALITGPNMAGKSTFLRQVALIALMAQAGSFVPAREATVGVLDRVFCRVGASDNLARGESTFMVEMTETANILRGAGRRSLVIMDEVGRGTGTNDGLAIAWAVTECLVRAIGAKTLFATHYHELTSLADSRIRNFSMEVSEHDREIVFLRRIVEGPSANSYGVHVARLAGVPDEVVERASEVLAFLIEREGRRAALPSAAAGRERRPADVQASLFAPEALIGEELRSLSVDRLTPLDALNLVAKWKREVEGGQAS